ncbi:MAG: YlxM family DNA-binding protein [Eubacteriales bacterium]|jgi:predicted DNA-binding protein YlxM (UPF0122 family)
MKGKSIELVLLFDFYGNMLTEKQREFFDLYYNQDLSLSEIAENEGITRQGVRDAIVRAKNILCEFEEKLGLHKRYGNIDESLEKILSSAEAIKNINATNFLSNPIDDRARDIIEIVRDLLEEGANYGV